MTLGTRHVMENTGVTAIGLRGYGFFNEGRLYLKDFFGVIYRTGKRFEFQFND